MLGHNSRKGHQGFTTKYPTLGDTKHVRVPTFIVQDIKVMLLLMEAIAADQGTERAEAILSDINDKLGDIIP